MHEMNRPTEEAAREAQALIPDLFHFLEDITHDRIVAGALLSRALAGYYAKLAVDHGDAPEIAETACIQSGRVAGRLAFDLVKEHGRRARLGDARSAE